MLLWYEHSWQRRFTPTSTKIQSMSMTKNQIALSACQFCNEYSRYIPNCLVLFFLRALNLHFGSPFQPSSHVSFFQPSPQMIHYIYKKIFILVFSYSVRGFMERIQRCWNYRETLNGNARWVPSWVLHSHSPAVGCTVGKQQYLD